MTFPLTVRLAELRGELEQSYRNTCYCSSTIVQEDGRLRTHYCGNRWCLVCNRIRTARAINLYHPVIEGWQNPYFVTLTARTVQGDELEARIGDLIRVFGNVVKSFRRRKEGIKAIRKLECTPRPGGFYHPHFHVVIEGEAEAQRFVEEWLKRWKDEADQAGQDVRPCDKNTLKEVFKYFTKLTAKREDGEGREFVQTERLDTIFRAIRGRRVWQPVGFKLPDQDDQGDQDEEGAIEDLTGTAEFKRFGEGVVWEWEQEVSDWVDTMTGDTLSGYTAPENLRRVVGNGEQAPIAEPAHDVKGAGDGDPSCGSMNVSARKSREANNGYSPHLISPATSTSELLQVLRRCSSTLEDQF